MNSKIIKSALSVSTIITIFIGGGTATATTTAKPDSDLVFTLPNENGDLEAFSFVKDESGESIIISEDGTPTEQKIVLHPQTGTLSLASRKHGDDIFEYAEGEVSFGFYSSNRGGIEVPPDYIYNPSLEPKARHDYCTESPDQFPAPGENADFSGACARHDMCYDRADARGTGYGPCNDQLRNVMRAVCRNVYGPMDPRRTGCLDFPDVYWGFVTGTHLGDN